LPGAQRGGGEVVSQSIVDALTAAGQSVRVVGYRRPADTSPTRPGELCAGRRPIETSAAGPRALAWMARALATRSPYSCAKYDSRAYVRAARSATGDGAAAVIADHAQVNFAIRDAGVGQPPLVFVAHNAEARVYEALAAGARGPSARWVNARESRLIRSVEADLARRARQVWALTAEDASYFHALVPDADVRALDVASAIAPPDRGREPDCDVALIGSWSWRANARGLDWFVREVVPRLSRESTIEVAGEGCDWLRRRHANVTVRGVVPDAQAFLARARVVAVPAVSGGGVQVKTLDAIATGVQVVATPTGVRGLGALPASVAVASSAADFAAALARPRDPGVRDAQRADALAWSAARRSRFDASVASWIAELAADDRDGTAVACRSR
jgi:hypothetical protein